MHEGRLALTLERFRPANARRFGATSGERKSKCGDERERVATAREATMGVTSDTASVVSATSFASASFASRSQPSRSQPSSCAPSSRATSAPVPDFEAASALEVLHSRIGESVANRYFEGEVRSLTPFGAFVRLVVSRPLPEATPQVLSVDELLQQIAAANESAAASSSAAAATAAANDAATSDASTASVAAAPTPTPTPLAQLRTKTEILPPKLRVDGLVSVGSLDAAYRKGWIGAAGASDAIAAGQRVRLYVESLDIQRRRLGLSLCAPQRAAPPTAEAFPALSGKPVAAAVAPVQCALPLPTPIPLAPATPLPTLEPSSTAAGLPEENSESALVDRASRLRAVLSAEAAEVKRPAAKPRVLCSLTLRRCRPPPAPPAAFCTRTLVGMAWKDCGQAETFHDPWSEQLIPDGALVACK